MSSLETTPAGQPEAQRIRGRGLTPRRALVVSIIAIAAALGVAVGLLVAFRGGGGESDLQTYFDEAAPVINDINRQTSQGEYSRARDILIRVAVVYTESKDKLSAIDPPPEVAESHQALITGLQDEANQFLTLADEQQFQATTSEELLNELFEDQETLAIAQRVDAACTNLQRIATENDIDVRLTFCVPEGS